MKRLTTNHRSIIGCACLLIGCLYGVFLPLASYADDSVCAQVQIEIRQELTLERQAFDAHMRINNGLTGITLDDVGIVVTFADEEGGSVLASSDPDNTEALFFIRVDSMENIDNVDGSGTVEPETSADIHWLIIPAIGASNGLESGTLYYVGATLTYAVGGEPYETIVNPDYIFVKPLPEITLDYFLTEDVYGDDAFTPEIEPSEPFTLGVLVSNNGSGIAENLKIDSAQPKIVDNDQGLLIDFVIQGCEVNGAPATPSLLADFDNIDPNTKGTARWIMSCSVSGKFEEFTADFSHSNELGGELTSLIDAVNAHLLIHDVLVDLPGRDTIRDFLATDGLDLRVHETDTVASLVTNQSQNSTLLLEGEYGSETHYILTAPTTAGFMYVKLTDPFAGQKIITSVIRSDGKNIPEDNTWLSRTREGSDPWQYFINIFDVNTTGSYRIVFDDINAMPQAPVLQFIPDRTGVETEQISFIVEASDPNGTIPSLSVDRLPPGAGFADQGNGTAIFDWTPAVGQAGTYAIRFIASDGRLEDSQRATLTIYETQDSDGDDMDDAWEMQHFGTLDRDGNGDFDNDGYSDMEEFESCSNPTKLLSYPFVSIVALNKGLNMIAIPADETCRPDLNEWMQIFGDSTEIEKVMAFDKLTGRYVKLLPEEVNPGFLRKHGEGILVYALKEKHVHFTSITCEPADFKQGMNVVGFTCPPDGYTAYQLLNDLGSENILSVQRFNNDTGRFESAGYDDSGQIIGKDFMIVNGEGYFIYMKQEVSGFDF